MTNPYSNNSPDAPPLDYSQQATPDVPTIQEDTVNPWATPPRPEEPAMGTVLEPENPVPPNVLPHITTDLPNGTPIRWGDSTVGYAKDGKVVAHGLAAMAIADGSLTREIEGELR